MGVRLNNYFIEYLPSVDIHLEIYKLWRYNWIKTPIVLIITYFSSFRKICFC